MALPTGDIVPTFPAGLGEIADLVLPVTGCRERIDGEFVHCQFPGGVGPQLAGVKEFPEFRVLFQTQAIGGEMLRLQFDGAVQCRAPLFQRLARQAEHQIKVQIIEAGRAQLLVSRHRCDRRVNPAQRLQQPVVERLDAERNPIHANFPKYRQLFRGDCGRVAFHRPFAVFLRVRQSDE